MDSSANLLGEGFGKGLPYFINQNQDFSSSPHCHLPRVHLGYKRVQNGPLSFGIVQIRPKKCPKNLDRLDRKSFIANALNFLIKCLIKS